MQIAIFLWQHTVIHYYIITSISNCQEEGLRFLTFNKKCDIIIFNVVILIAKGDLEVYFYV